MNKLLAVYLLTLIPVANGQQNFWPEVGNGIAQGVNTAADGISQAAEDIGNEVGNQVDVVATELGNQVDVVATELENQVSNAANDIGNQVDQAANDIVDQASNAANDIGNQVSDQVNDLSNQAVDAINNQIDAAQNQVEELIIQGGTDLANSLTSETQNQLHVGLDDAADAVESGIDAAANGAATAVGAIRGAGHYAIDDPAGAAEAAANGIDQGVNAIGTFLEDPEHHTDQLCFSSQTTADVEGKGTTTMENIQVGDKVLTSNGDYATIYSIDHRHLTKSTAFIQIHTDVQQSPLELTHRHMLFVEGNANPVPAASVKVGDQVQTLQGPTAITKIDTVTRAGLFSPLTVDGTIVASGIVASSYSAFLSNSEWIEIAGLKIMSHQTFYNMALKPYRYMCTGLSLELCKTSNEKVAISEFANDLYEHSRQYSEMIQNAMLTLVILFVGVYNLILSPYSLILALSTYSLTRRSKKSKTVC